MDVPREWIPNPLSPLIVQARVGQPAAPLASRVEHLRDCPCTDQLGTVLSVFSSTSIHSTQLNVAVLFRVGKTACFASFFNVRAYRQICLHKRGNRKLFQNLEMIHPSTPLIGLISRRSTMIHVCMCRLRLIVHFKVPCAADKQHCRPSINPCSPSTKLRQLIGFVTGNCMCLNQIPSPACPYWYSSRIKNANSALHLLLAG
jgi:hypothetical protein